MVCRSNRTGNYRNNCRKPGKWGLSCPFWISFPGSFVNEPCSILASINPLSINARARECATGSKTKQHPMAPPVFSVLISVPFCVDWCKLETGESFNLRNRYRRNPSAGIHRVQPYQVPVNIEQRASLQEIRIHDVGFYVVVVK